MLGTILLTYTAYPLLVFRMGGPLWGTSNFKSYHANMYTYLSKGVADYVAVWDFKDFFIPKGKHKNLREVLTAVESPSGPAPKFSDVSANSLIGAGTRGMADNDPHPFCYLLLRSEKTQIDKPELYTRSYQNQVTAVRQHDSVASQKRACIAYLSLHFHHTSPSQVNEVIRLDPWVGQQFTSGPERQSRRKGFENSIRPTRTIFHGSLYQASACRLPHGWNGCEKDNEVCIKSTSLVAGDTSSMMEDNRGIQYFDGMVTARDAKAMDRESDGVLSHLSFDERLIATTQREGRVRGEYATLYFPAVYAALESRGLVMPIELQETVDMTYERADSGWMPYTDFLSSVEGAERGGSKGMNPRLDLANDIDRDHSIYFSDILPPSYDSALDANVNVTSLPAFARDNSEVFLASVLERKADSWDLHVTTFMMCHALLVPDSAPGVEKDMKALRIGHRRDTLLSWSKTIHAFKNVTYLDSGTRAESPRYFCRIRTTSRHEPYIVQGELLFPQFNFRYNCMRCSM